MEVKRAPNKCATGSEILSLKRPYGENVAIWMKSKEEPRLMDAPRTPFAPRENQRFSRGDPVYVSGRDRGSDTAIHPFLTLVENAAIWMQNAKAPLVR